jgi:hypothetical protein
MKMIEQGIIVGKPFSRKQFFGIKSAIRLAVLGMSFVGNVSRGMIIRHGDGIEWVLIRNLA